MVSATTSWSPNSHQIRLAFQCKKFPSRIARTSMNKMNLNIRSCLVAQYGSHNGNGMDTCHTGDSWMCSCSSNSESFSGWSDSNGIISSNEYSRKRQLTEIMGSAVAGVLLFAGLTFASISLGKRCTFEPKQLMKPLTEQAKMSLALESQSDRVQKDLNEFGSLENTSINEDSFSSQQPRKSSIEDIFDKGTDAGMSSTPNSIYTSNDIEAINNTSMQKYLKHVSKFDCISLPSETNITSPKLPEAKDSDEFFTLKGSDDNVDVAKSDQNTQLKGNMVDVSNAIQPQPDGEPSDFLLDSFYNSLAHLPNELSTLNLLQSLEVNAASEHDVLSSDDIKILDRELDKTLQGNLVELCDLTQPQEGETAEILLNSSSKSIAHLPDEFLILNLPESQGVDEVRESCILCTDNVEFLDFDSNKTVEFSAGKNEYEKLYDSRIPQNFSSTGFPAPSAVSTSLQARPGKILVPAVVEQIQGQALAALQVLKVIEGDIQPSDICTRREYARWIVSASSALSRNVVSKVYPAMYIENVTELAFDDVMPEDPDFSSIQGLAEAGLISSKLSRRDMLSSSNEDIDPFCFSPESPVSRQALVSWKMAMEKETLPKANRKIMHDLSGFIDIDKIDPGAWPAIIADLYAGDQGIIALAFGYTKLFQPEKLVTKAQAAVALVTGKATDIFGEALARIEAESIAESAVVARSSPVGQVEKDIRASFEKELLLERENVNVVERLAKEATHELEKLKAQWDEKSITLLKERVAIESEMEALSRLRREVEEELSGFLNNKAQVSHEKEKISQLRKVTENENREIVRLHYELDVERKALSMARTWAEDEAKKAREQAKALEAARDRWEKKGIKVIAGSDFHDASSGITWLKASDQFSVEKFVKRGENLVETLKAVANDVRGKSKETIEIIIQRIVILLSKLREWMDMHASKLKDVTILRVKWSAKKLEQRVSKSAKQVVGDCKEGVEKLAQKFKT